MPDEGFEREKACYEQNFEQARSLNGQMNNVPVLAMTLTGGLWFAAGINEDISAEIRFLLLLFTGFCNLALILVIIRIRDVFYSYLERIKLFHPESFATGRPQSPRVPGLGDYSMISIYCALLGLATLLSFNVAMFLSSDGRLYTDMTTDTLRAILRQVPDTVVVETWTSEGEGRLKGQDRWLNAIVRRCSEGTQL